MRRTLCFMLCILLCFVITACGSTAPESYVQREGIARPDSIEAETGSTTLTFSPSDAEYGRLYDALMENWWLAAKNTPDTATDAELVISEGLHELKTKTWRTYRQGDDNFVIFRYEDGIDWTNYEGKTITVKSVFFLIPEYTEDCDNIRGYFSASESGQMGINEGMYTFYYPAEITEGFFHWLLHTEKEAG